MRGACVPRRRAVLATLGIVAAMGLAGACGGDDEPAAAGGSETGQASSGGSLAERADALIGCLEDEGKTASVKDTEPFGVEDATVGVESSPLPNQYGGDPSSVTVWLFEDEGAAEEGRPAITLSREDTVRTQLIGRSVLVYGIVPPDEERAIYEGCLVAPVT